MSGSQEATIQNSANVDQSQAMPNIPYDPCLGKSWNQASETGAVSSNEVSTTQAWVPVMSSGIAASTPRFVEENVVEKQTVNARDAIHCIPTSLPADGTLGQNHSVLSRTQDHHIPDVSATLPQSHHVPSISRAPRIRSNFQSSLEGRAQSLDPPPPVLPIQVSSSWQSFAQTHQGISRTPVWGGSATPAFQPTGPGAFIFGRYPPPMSEIPTPIFLPPPSRLPIHPTQP